MFVRREAKYNHNPTHAVTQWWWKDKVYIGDGAYPKAEQLAEKLYDVVTLEKEQRLYKELVYLTSGDRAVSPGCCYVTIATLAERVNCSRETAGRVLKDFGKRGLIHREGRFITVFETQEVRDAKNHTGQDLPAAAERETEAS